LPFLLAVFLFQAFEGILSHTRHIQCTHGPVYPCTIQPCLFGCMTPCIIGNFIYPVIIHQLKIKRNIDTDRTRHTIIAAGAIQISIRLFSSIDALIISSSSFVRGVSFDATRTFSSTISIVLIPDSAQSTFGLASTNRKAISAQLTVFLGSSF